MSCTSRLKIYKELLISKLNYFTFNNVCLSILLIVEEFYLTINSFKGLKENENFGYPLCIPQPGFHIWTYHGKVSACGYWEQ